MNQALLAFAAFLSISGSAFAAEAAGPAPMRICQFSLNNEDEFTATKEFIDRVNRASPVPIEIREFMTEGSDPNKSFEKMVASGVKCDGLVISGHHTGSYSGHRAKGKLSMDFMESLSCDPKYTAFFRNLNAAWLQGCRTLGVGEIQAEDDQVDADFHTNRVGQAVEEDGLPQSFAELNMEFSNTLDQDNPLASRYLRLFPNAKLFGWTRSAPGEKSRSYLSVLYHMAQTARRLDAEDKFPFDAPDAPTMSAASAAKFADAMLLTLSHFSAEQKGCESVAVDGWLAHGNVGRPGKYFFDNPDLKAYTSLASSGDKDLLEAKQLDCMLKAAAKAKDQAAMLNALDLLSHRPEFLRYSFNTLVDLRNQLANAKDEKGKQVANEILTAMKSDPQLSPRVMDFLKSKMASRQVGLQRKIDYYKFYNLLTGTSDPAVEKEIQDRAVGELGRPLPPVDPQAHNPLRSRNLAADYRATLVQALIKNKVVDPTFYDQLLAKQPDSDVLADLVAQVPNYVPQNRVQRLLAIVASPAADHNVEVMAWNRIKAMGLPDDVLEKVHDDFLEAQKRRPERPTVLGDAPEVVVKEKEAADQPKEDALDFIGNIFRRR